MSTKHVRTTADLVRFRCSARIECQGCHAARTMSGVELAMACGSVPLGSATEVRAVRGEGGESGGVAAGLTQYGQLYGPKFAAERRTKPQ